MTSTDMTTSPDKQAITAATLPVDVIKMIDSDHRLASPHTKRCYKSDLARFLQWRGVRPMSTGLVSDYVTHLEEQAKARRTINRALAVIRWYASRSASDARQKLIIQPGNPELEMQASMGELIAEFDDVKGSEVMAGRHIPAGELLSLIAACPATPSGVRNMAIIAIASGAGLRRAEIAGLRLDDLRPDDNGGYDLLIRGKGSKQREVPIAGGTVASLNDWLAFRGDGPGAVFCPVSQRGKLGLPKYNEKTEQLELPPVSTEALAQMLDRVSKRAGLPKRATWHDFRRTYIGNLLDSGADVVTVQKLAGHANANTTARYDRRPAAARKRAIGALHVPYIKRTLPVKE